MAQTIRPRTKVVYDTQQERRNSTPAGVAAYDAARGAQITPQRLAPQRPPFSEMPMGQANYQPRVAAPAQAQQPQTQQFGGQPAPRAGTPQAANWMQAPQQQAYPQQQMPQQQAPYQQPGGIPPIPSYPRNAMEMGLSMGVAGLAQNVGNAMRGMALDPNDQGIPAIPSYERNALGMAMRGITGSAGRGRVSAKPKVVPQPRQPMYTAEQSQQMYQDVLAGKYPNHQGMADRVLNPNGYAPAAPFAVDEPSAGYGERIGPITYQDARVNAASDRRVAGMDRLHGQQMQNIQGQADAASGVYDQMGRPSVGSRFAQQQAGGYTTDQYGRQYQMTPEMAGTAPGQTGWVQGQSLGGAPHGIYVQGNLPRPEGGMDRVAAGQQGLRPSAFSGPKSSAAIAGMAGFGETAGTGPGAQRYNDMKTRRQQMADQRIVARARMRGLGQNTPAVRAAMQRQGMLTPGQGVPGGQPGGLPPGTPAGESPNANVDAREFDFLSGNPGVQVLLAQEGVEPTNVLNSATPDRFETAMLQQNLSPADYNLLQRSLRVRMARDEPFRASLNDWQRSNFDQFLKDPKKFQEAHRDRLLRMQQNQQSDRLRTRRELQNPDALPMQ